MDVIEARQHISNVENGLKLALLVVAGIGGAITLVAFLGAAMTKKQLEAKPEQPCTNC